MKRGDKTQAVLLSFFLFSSSGCLTAFDANKAEDRLKTENTFPSSPVTHFQVNSGRETQSLEEEGCHTGATEEL